MKQETKFKLSVMPLLIGSAIYFGLYVKDNEFHTWPEVEPNSVTMKYNLQPDGTHYHCGKECQYEGLECPELLQAQADAELRHNVINGTDTAWFHNGEILYPDYVHPDTMVVINAKFLNEEWVLNKHGLVDGSDDSLWELISEATVNIEDYQDYINVVKK